MDAFSMTMLGWSALGSLITKVITQSSSFSETLSYTSLALAVCAATSALLTLAASADRKEPFRAKALDEEERERLRVLATQARFADSRVRLLSLTEHPTCEARTAGSCALRSSSAGIRL